jgi:hypothetical protein
MGAQRVKSHELTWEDIDRMREEEAQLTVEETQELGSVAVQLVQEAPEETHAQLER